MQATADPYSDPIRQKVIIMLIAWPPLIGASAGLGLGLLTDHITLALKTGAAVGLAGGAILALLALLLMSGLIPTRTEPAQADVRIVDMPPPAPEQIRIIPYHGNPQTRLIDGIDERDLAAFIDGLPTRGHAQKGWLSVPLPSGRIVDPELWGQLSAPLRKAGIITDVKPRSSGKLVQTDPARIKEILGITELN